MANKLLGIVIILLVLLYVVSPVDLFPGPIDDAIFTICGIAAAKNRLSAGSRK